MAEREIPNLYTIARARSAGMNRVFYNRGYELDRDPGQQLPHRRAVRGYARVVLESGEMPSARQCWGR